MISKEEISHIAKLARLELSLKEFEKMQKDLSQILDYFKLLKTSSSAKASADKQKLKVKNKLRADEAVSKDTSLADRLLASVPERKDRYIKVKAIF